MRDFVGFESRLVGGPITPLILRGPRGRLPRATLLGDCNEGLDVFLSLVGFTTLEGLE